MIRCLFVNVPLQKDSKYDPELEQQIREWINAVVGGQVLKPEPDSTDFHDSLKDGQILVEYVGIFIKVLVVTILITCGPVDQVVSIT